jgi:redox-sensitive bicupin YhaK (pirin superfamily)
MIQAVIQQRRKDLGGFIVGRVLPAIQQRMVGPFIFFDHMGPVDFPAGIPRTVDVRPHPHIGLSTVTYLFAGEIMHRDSLGVEQAIRPAEVNWMVAGRGITHSERFERARAVGDSLHGIQAWLALPREHEETVPIFNHYAASELPALAENGATGRLIAGELSGVCAPAKTFSPLFYLHWQMSAGATVPLSAQYPERAAYVATGNVSFEGINYAAGSMLIFSPGRTIQLTAETPAEILLLGGEPVGERFIEWNFVSSSRERIEQAKADWRAGRMKLPDLDAQEFIPLP